VPNKAYNQEFKMHMEGVLIPFKSAMVTCTPNGVEANVNLFSNIEAYNLKPKTAVQIFYRDWVNVGEKPGWRLMFDGALSSYYKTDNSNQGRGLGIVCRDFRMDIRKAPAAMAFESASELSSIVYYHHTGLFNNFVVRGINVKDIPKDKAKRTTRVYGNSGLNDLGEVIAYIAGTAYGTGLKIQKDGEYAYSKKYATSLKERTEKKGDGDDDTAKADAGLFLDAVIRGMWNEASSGTAMGNFFNKRIRVDKRFLVPKNNAGFRFWTKQHAGLNIGTVLMGNSRFSSLEAAIMRLAGLFSVRVYSCNTPSLISVGDDVNDESEENGYGWVIDPQVKKTLVDGYADFGGKFILNETMLLPPMEFTSPPNCNIIFPPMYENVTWQYDMDADITRGYFKQIDSLTGKGGNQLAAISVQVPNALFNIKKGEKESKKDYEARLRDEYGRKKPPLTLEERYKGVNLFNGSVEHNLAADDATSIIRDSIFNKRVRAKIDKDITELESEIAALGNASEAGTKESNELSISEKAKVLKLKKDAQGQLSYSKSQAHKKNTVNALRRHALLKFLGLKYAGRVAVVDMHFNPYMMCGFPGAIYADDEAYGKESMKTIIGMVQQIKHTITISNSGADAKTSVVMNNARLVDEPTDFDCNGSPQYARATDPEQAKVDYKTLKMNKEYFVQEPKSFVKQGSKNKAYDLDEIKPDPNFPYAKDLLTLTRRDIANGERNQVYLDEAYEPNRIAPFYKNVFKHATDHFMIGTATVNTEEIKFAYDTMHEAFVELKKSRSYLMHDYEKCMQFVARDVCSADAFFQGILGLSRNVFDDTGQDFYETKLSDFNDHEIDDRYYGVGTDKWQTIDDLDVDNGGHMTGPGQFSSIREHSPITPFIKERRDAVEAYKKLADQIVQGA